MIKRFEKNLLAPFSVGFLLFSIGCGFLDINYKVHGTSIAKSGRVEVYKFEPGQDEELLAETTLENYNFEFALNPKINTILLRLKNFSYFDFIDHKNLIATDDTYWETLISNVHSDEETPLYNINPVTTIASALAKHKIQSTQPTNKEELVNLTDDSNDMVGRHFGDINVLTSNPSSLDTSSNSLTNGIKYSFILSTFTELAHFFNDNSYASLTPSEVDLNMSSFTKIIYDDIIFDGFLDGVAEYGSTTLSHMGESSQFLRAYTSLSLFRLFNNPSLNKTGLTFEHAIDLLNDISLSQATFFRDGSPVYRFNQDPPVIDCSNPKNGDEINGTLEIACDISDESPGVYNANVKIAEFNVANNYSTPEYFNATIDTTALAHGPQTIEVNARDKVGNQTLVFIDIIIND